jgi:hypothetical protein
MQRLFIVTLIAAGLTNASATDQADQTALDLARKALTSPVAMETVTDLTLMGPRRFGRRETRRRLGESSL